jgi:hypothetical protein
MERGAITGCIEPWGSEVATSVTLARIRTTAWSGSLPTRKRAMTMPPDGCEVE